MSFYTRYRRPDKDDLPIVRFSLPSKAVQDFKDEADINHLVNRFSETGSFYDPLSVNRARVPVFADVSFIPSDFLEAKALVDDAKARFDSLPSSVRDRFKNDPYALLAFLQDKKNRSEAEELGLVDKISITPPPTEPDGGSSSAT